MSFLWSRVPVRSAEPELLDTFFVSAVSTVNAIEIAERLAVGTIAVGDRERALALLDRADPSEPLVPMLRQRFRAAAVGTEHATRATRLAHAASARYAAIAGSRWFRR